MGTTFSTNDIRGRVDDTLTTEHVWNVGKALAEWLPDEGSVVIARGAGANESLVHALSEGVLLQGCDVIDAGAGDQQTVVTTINDKSAAGGALVVHDELQNIEIIVLFDASGVVVTTDTGLGEIDQLVDAGNFVPAAEKGELRNVV